MPDVDGAIEEVLVALKDGSANGVVLLANIKGSYLGDPAFDPLMEELERQHALAFVHPTPLRGMHTPRFRPAAADFLLDTTRAAMGLVTSGTVSRFPSVRFILSHGGGFVPYAAHRIAWLTEMFDDRYNDGRGGMSAEEILAGLRTFYFDLAHGVERASARGPAPLHRCKPPALRERLALCRRASRRGISWRSTRALATSPPINGRRSRVERPWNSASYRDHGTREGQLMARTRHTPITATRKERSNV